MPGGALGTSSHSIHGQEAERGEGSHSPTFSFLFSLGPRPVELVLPTAKVGLSTSVKITLRPAQRRVT